jgi:RNA polymerase sigma-70 factor (ECF subfamily)
MTSRPGQPAPEALLAHHSFLVSLARSLVGDEHAAEDAVQETWVRALERPPRSASGARAWLARVTASRARNSIRGASRRRAREARGARAER